MKKLYKIETIISFKEYLKIKQFFKNSFKKIILIDILLIIVSFFIFIKDLNIIFLFCSMSILILYLNFILICLTTMFNYYHYCKKKNNLKYDLVLNENHIKRIKNEKKEIIQYNEVYKIKEDAKKFVFVLKEFSIKILKSQCRKEDITFIRKIIHKKEDENNDNIKNIKLSKKLNSIFNITLILFFIMLVINLYLTKKVVNNPYKYMWSMIFILPFSIKSIIMGLKYKDCTRNRKNIISGILITFLAIIYSLLTLIPINNNYSKAFQFERILGIELPDTGIYQKEEINTSYHYFAHEFLFLNKNEYLLTEKEIKANNNWVKLDGMTKDVIYFLPILCSYDCYYSIYFEEANKYNKLPKEEGKYHIYAMLYDEKQHILRIDEYNYNL